MKRSIHHPIIQVSTMTDSADEAATIADTLVRERLAACAQVLGPADSVYWWKGTVENAREWQCILKTREDLYEKVEARIRALHSYQLPAIIAVPVLGGSAPYLQWINDEVEAG